MSIGSVGSSVQVNADDPVGAVVAAKVLQQTRQEGETAKQLIESAAQPTNDGRGQMVNTYA